MNLPRSFRYPVVFLFFVIVLLPICYLIGSAFYADSGDILARLTGVFEPRQWGLICNSFIIGAGATCFSFILGVPYAFLCLRTDLKFRKIFTWIYIIPLLIPPYIHAIAWGHLADFFETYFFFDIHGKLGIIIVLTCSYFPFIVLIAISALKGIDRNMEEAALLNRGRGFTLWKITLPLAMPNIISGAILVFIFSIINVSVPDFLRVKVYPLEIFIQFSAFYDELAAVFLALPIMGLAYVLILCRNAYIKDKSFVQISAGQKRHIRFELGKCRVPALIFCVFPIGCSVFLPVFVLLGVAGPFSTYIEAAVTSTHQIGYSLVLACLGSISTMILGGLTAYIMVRSADVFSKLLSFCVFIPLAVPATAFAIGLIGVWNRGVIDVVYGSSLIIIFGYIARFLPFAVIIFLSGLAQIGRNLEETAVMAGASTMKVIGKIVFPLLKQYVSAVFFIVFILSFGELGTTLLIIPPGRETIPIKIYNLMHYGADQLVAALCLILVGIILVTFAFFLLWYRKFAATAQDIQ